MHRKDLCPCTKFRLKRSWKSFNPKVHKLEVDSSQPLDVEQEGGRRTRASLSRSLKKHKLRSLRRKYRKSRRLSRKCANKGPKTCRKTPGCKYVRGKRGKYCRRVKATRRYK